MNAQNLKTIRESAKSVSRVGYTQCIVGRICEKYEFLASHGRAMTANGQHTLTKNCKKHLLLEKCLTIVVVYAQLQISVHTIHTTV